MNNYVLIHKSSPFKRLATLAAETEKAGAYDFAAETWAAAAALARRDCNRKWASERSALCANAQLRGWGTTEMIKELRHADIDRDSQRTA